jgi:hypothetical protein
VSRQVRRLDIHKGFTVSKPRALTLEIVTEGRCHGFLRLTVVASGPARRRQRAALEDPAVSMWLHVSVYESVSWSLYHPILVVL